jgi:hypothetical protein
MNHWDAERCDQCCFSFESIVIINNLYSTRAAFAGHNINLTGYNLNKNVSERKVLLAMMRKRNLNAFQTVYGSF